MLDIPSDSDCTPLDNLESLGNALSTSRRTLERISVVFASVDAYSRIWITLREGQSPSLAFCNWQAGRETYKRHA